MSLAFKKTLATLILVFAAFALAPPAFAEDSTVCDAEIDLLEEELDALDADCFAAIDSTAAERDEAIRNLAAESAVRAGLQVTNEKLETALGRKREELAAEQARKPSRAAWFAAGAATTAIAVVIIVLAVN